MMKKSINITYSDMSDMYIHLANAVDLLQRTGAGARFVVVSDANMEILKSALVSGGCESVSINFIRQYMEQAKPIHEKYCNMVDGKIVPTQLIGDNGQGIAIKIDGLSSIKLYDVRDRSTIDSYIDEMVKLADSDISKDFRIAMDKSVDIELNIIPLEMLPDNIRIPVKYTRLLSEI